MSLLDGKKAKAGFAKRINLPGDKHDPVNHPKHYTDGKIEHIEYAKDRGWLEGYCLGNASKYMHRAGKKGDKIEDLEKARWYIDYLITYLKEKN